MKTPRYAPSKILTASKKSLVKLLWETEHQVYHTLTSSSNLIDARMRLATYLNNMENQYFHLFSDDDNEGINMAQRNNAKESIRVLKNIIRVENENVSGCSALELLFKLAKNPEDILPQLSKGFLCEFLYLFLAIQGKSLKSLATADSLKDLNGREAATLRSKQLDNYALTVANFASRYPCACGESRVASQATLKKDILKYFKASEGDWEDTAWQMKHIIKDYATLKNFISLNKQEKQGLKLAEEYNIDVHITPYYLSLFNKSGRCNYDRVVRAQVIPSAHYCEAVNENRKKGLDLDFMGEKSTSPIDCVTRRYPQILILKPFDACPQICVYCQRNWEIKDVDKTCITNEKVEEAIKWIDKNSEVTEVLITGGDPLTMGDGDLDAILEKVSQIDHVERIRIGTRTLVTLPYRITDNLCKILAKYHQLGKRELSVVTHFEHVSEISPDAQYAIRKIREIGISVYNQQVFTYFNSRKFETCALRKKLKLSGIDPYYTFNTKGKEETLDFRVPIARIEQEMKEEARLLPGLVRTDEPVFNVPKLGKSHLRAWQDHEPIMITPDGRRVFRFYPWESNLVGMDSYVYTDVSIYDYLKRLQKDGENVDEYNTIWFYF